MENMRKVNVRASSEYDILVGKGLLDRAGELISKVKKPCSAVIITDSNVDVLYSERLKKSLVKEGFEVYKFTFNAGEKSKNATTFIEILEKMAQWKITRSDLVIALGGGVVGDITGFASACYLRGIDFVQIPTTLLSAVDSSVGGKTAIDLLAGKNLAGAFYQPRLVICDTDTFSTLPQREIACGYAEVIKYAVLFDEEFFTQLDEGKTDIDTVVEKCVTFKRDVVQRDEFDKGERKLLNLGHTAAHGIEKVSDFEVSHGEAVAVGTVIAAKISENKGLCQKGISEKIRTVLNKYNLPDEYDVSAQQLYEAAKSDKKREGEKITLVLVEKIGKCVLCEVDVEELEEMFSKALQK